MRYREVYLEKAKGISDSGTTIIDLDLVDPISAILLDIEATNGATSCQNKRIHEDISKIEVVDGGDVLFSMSMTELLGLNSYLYGAVPYHIWDEGAAAVQHDTAIIPFGKRVGDKGLMLDPKKFRNLQLKITHALTISGTAGFATTTGKITAIAKVVDAGFPEGPLGFLLSKNIYSFTSLASGEEVIELPVDHDHLGLMLRVFETGITPQTDITKVKVSVDEDKYVPFEFDLADWIAYLQRKYNEFSISQKLLQTDGDSFESRLGEINAAFANAVNDLDLASLDAVAAGKLTLQLLTLAVTPTIAKSTTDTAVFVKAFGYMPFDCLIWWWDPLWRPNHNLRKATLKSIKAKLTQGGAGAAVSLITIQERLY